MKYNRRAIILAALCFMLLLAVGAGVLAQSSARFSLAWHVVGSGGGESASASYRVHGTVGQSVVGPPQAAGGAFVVTSGYWVFDTRRIVYLPTVSKR